MVIVFAEVVIRASLPHVCYGFVVFATSLPSDDVFATTHVAAVHDHARLLIDTVTGLMSGTPSVPFVEFESGEPDFALVAGADALARIPVRAARAHGVRQKAVVGDDPFVGAGDPKYAVMPGAEYAEAFVGDQISPR